MNIKEIKELVKMLDGTDITELTFESEGSKVSIKKGTNISNINHQAPIMQYPSPNMMQPVTAPPQTNPNTAKEEQNEGLGPNQVLISAPMVGTF